MSGEGRKMEDEVEEEEGGGGGEGWKKEHEVEEEERHGGRAMDRQMDGQNNLEIIFLTHSMSKKAVNF